MDYYKSPLTIYVVWHPENTLGLKYAEALYNIFCRDTLSPLVRGLGIPICFRFRPPADQKVPIDIDFIASDRNAVVLLIDDKLFLDDHWYSYIQKLLDGENNENRVFPVALSSTAISIDEERIQKKQFIKLSHIGDADEVIEFTKRIAELKSRLLHDLARMFFNMPKVTDDDEASAVPPIKLFISHAKVDGEKIAASFRDYVLSTKKIKTFFDASDIQDADDFTRLLIDNLKRSAIVVFLSDQYSTREWCRIEVLVAKRNKSPIVVVNGLQDRERRSFPYLGNVPTIRLKQDSFDDIIDLALFQVLNNLYQEEKLAKEVKLHNLGVKYKVVVIQNAPELFNYIDIKRMKDDGAGDIIVVYPDPPLGAEELHVLNDVDPNIHFLTPTALHNMS